MSVFCLQGFKTWYVDYNYPFWRERTKTILTLTFNTIECKNTAHWSIWWPWHVTFEFEKILIGSSIFHQKPLYQNNIIVPQFKFVFTWPTRCGQNHTQTEAQSHTTIYPSIDDRIKLKKKLYAERPTCMTPPPWPSLEWRKQSGSSSILASQSKTTISNSVQAGLEA